MAIFLQSLLLSASVHAERVILADVNVVDVEQGIVLPPRDILVEGGVIAEVAQAGALRGGERARRIVLQGRYLLPGLIDGHVHVDHPSILTVMPAYGVTTALNMRGDRSHVLLRNEIANGERWGTSFFTAGDYMEGWPPDFPFTQAFAGVDALPRAVARARADGFDFLKVYETFSLEQFRVFMAAARSSDMPVIGHVPPDVPFETVLEQSLAAIAHLEEIVRVINSRAESAEARVVLARELAALIAAAPQYSCVITNLDYLSNLILAQNTDLAGFLSAPEFAYVHPSVLQFFRPGFNGFERRDAAWRARAIGDRQTTRALLLALHERGACLIAGTDAFAPGVPGGDSLIGELRALEAAGLSRAEALRSATLAAADFVNETFDPPLPLGRIAPGFQADLVVMDGNPLESFSALDRVAGVMLDGRWRGRTDLDEDLRTISKRNAQIDMHVRRIESLLRAGDLPAAARALQRAELDHREDGPLFHLYTLPGLIAPAIRRLRAGEASEETCKALVAIARSYAHAYPYAHASQKLLAEVAIMANDRAAATAGLESAATIHPDDPQLAELRHALSTFH